MENITVPGMISLFPSSKTEQAEFVRQLVDNVLSGNIDPLKAEIQICNIEQVCKAYRANDDIQDAVLTEAEKYGAKTFDLHGANIQIKEVGVKYDYSLTFHHQYNDICEKIEELAKEKKQIEEIMKLHKEAWVYTDINTGESYEVLPAVKTSTTRAVITIKK